VRYLLTALLFFMLSSEVLALTDITATGIAGSGFPVALTTAGETYQLTENISCGTTCFTTKASNITVDLNTFTATFGADNNPGVSDTGMEAWTDSSTLANWTMLSGTVAQSSAIQWGDYAATLSPTASIKSDTVTLNAGQTYVYYAVVRGASTDSYVVSLNRASDDEVLATASISGALLERGFSMADGVIPATENEYKPVENVDVYLKITCSGAANKVLHVADIRPAKHYFLINSSYYQSVLTPDIASSFFSTAITGLTITNGTIAQGAGGAVKSAALYMSASDGLNVNNVTITLSGNNTTGIRAAGSVTLDTISTNTTSILNFNRMHPPATFDLIPAATGAIEVSGCTLLNDPEMSIRMVYGYLLDTDTHTTSIHDNLIRGKEQVTEGYAIALSSIGNATIYNNDINPYSGRGILVDASSGAAGYISGSKNVTIRDNTIQNIHEFPNVEYGATALEAVAIRIRDWGGTNPVQGHRNLKIYENTISVYVDSTTTHRSYGINTSTKSAVSDIEIYDNTITAALNSSGGADWEAVAIAMQNIDMPEGGVFTVRNNVISGNIGFRFGGNDGAPVKGVSIYSNTIATDKAALHYDGYLGPFSDNSIYCNAIENTATDGHIVYFADGTPTVSNQYFSNNLFTNANSSGYEVFTTKDYSASALFCGSGTVDVTGGGSIGSASAPCQDGATGCYSSAGLSGGTPSDIIAPVVTPSKQSGRYTTPQTVELSANETATFYYTLDGTTPTESSTEYSAAIPVLQNEAETELRVKAKDAAGNWSTEQVYRYKCQICR